jgi:hypothetical protein
MEENNDVEARLAHLIDVVFKMGRNEFAREIGETPASLSRYINRKNESGADLYKKIKKRFPQTNMNWLIGGDGVPLLDQEETFFQKKIRELESTVAYYAVKSALGKRKPVPSTASGLRIMRRNNGSFYAVGVQNRAQGARKAA